MIATSKVCLKCGIPITESRKYCSTKCGDNYRQIVYRQNKREQIKDKARKKREENYRRLKDYIGTYKCVHCGFTHKSTTPFDFHHTDTTTKEYNPSNLMAASWEKLKKEIDKCVLLCKNCHALEHERLRNNDSNI